VFVQAGGSGGDAVMPEQPGGAAGVLGGDQLYGAQDPEGAKRDVLEVPDRRRD